MKQEQFTKWPWKLNISPLGSWPEQILGANETIVAHVRWEDGSPFYDKPKEETEANAHLIAAAPDMYESLKTLIAVLDPLLNNPAHESVMIKAKNAISKANPTNRVKNQ